MEISTLTQLNWSRTTQLRTMYVNSIRLILLKHPVHLYKQKNAGVPCLYVATKDPFQSWAMIDCFAP